MSFVSKPGSPRLLGTRTANALDPRLLNASAISRARLVKKSTESIAQPAPPQPKTK